MSDMFGDIFGGLGGNPPPSGPRTTSTPKKKVEKGLPWRAKTLDGELYLPLAQVVELLKQNDVLPAVRRGLEKHLKKD
jgi:hypothetical protein